MGPRASGRARLWWSSVTLHPRQDVYLAVVSFSSEASVRDGQVQPPQAAQVPVRSSD